MIVWWCAQRKVRWPLFSLTLAVKLIYIFLLFSPVVGGLNSYSYFGSIYILYLYLDVYLTKCGVTVAQHRIRVASGKRKGSKELSQSDR